MGTARRVHGDTAAFANVLANLGVRADEGEPISEAMVLGVGGGLGAGYILWEFEAHGIPARVYTRVSTVVAVPGAVGAESAERLGLHAQVHETRGAARRGGARRTARSGAYRRSSGSTAISSDSAASRSRSTAAAARRSSSMGAEANLPDRRPLSLADPVTRDRLAAARARSCPTSTD